MGVLCLSHLHFIMIIFRFFPVKFYIFLKTSIYPLILPFSKTLTKFFEFSFNVLHISVSFEYPLKAQQTKRITIMKVILASFSFHVF